MPGGSSELSPCTETSACTSGGTAVERRCERAGARPSSTSLRSVMERSRVDCRASFVVSLASTSLRLAASGSRSLSAP